jgi:hypothetical protein
MGPRAALAAGVGRGSEVVEKSLGDRQLRLRELVDQPM